MDTRFRWNEKGRRAGNAVAGKLCADEPFAAGDLLKFNMILFENAIVYFNQYIQAFFAFGNEGTGKEHTIRTDYRENRGNDRKKACIIK